MKINKILIDYTLIIIMAILCITVMVMPNINVAYADSFNLTQDGQYKVPIKTDMKMGGDSFANYVLVDKISENYYMTFIVLDRAAVAKTRLATGSDKRGEISWVEGSKEYHQYTLSKEELQSTLRFEAFVNAMQADIDFNINLQLSSASKTDVIIDKTVERPARFVPNIVTNAGDAELEKGSTFQIPDVKATLSGDDVPVTVNAYYIKDGVKEEIEIVNNKIVLDNVGEYHIVYRAESSKYKTNLNNNTYSEYNVKLMSKVGATSLARIEEIGDNNVLPKGASVQAGKVKEDSDIYKNVQQKMKEIADNFEVVSVTIYNEDGSELNPANNIALYLNANNTYDRSKINVYHIEADGSLQKIPCDSYGRYVRLETNKTGSFVICVPGVKFVMPMWGYGCIALSVLPVLIVIIMAIVCPIVKKKKEIKKQEAIANGTYVEKPKKEKVKKEKVKKEKKTKK